MFKRIVRYVSHNWQLSLAVLGIVAGFVLHWLQWNTAEHWVLGLGALLLAIPSLVEMWHEWRSGGYGLNILPVVATVTAVVLHQYWVALLLVTVLIIMRELKFYAARRARQELADLHQYTPHEAHVLRGRKLVDVAASAIQPGDKIVINPGEIVPVDAVIFEGESSFDETALLGVSSLVTHGVDDQIMSGTINQQATVSARATQSAAHSQYQHMVKLMRAAALQPAPFVRLAGRFTIAFTILCLAIAAVAWYLGGYAVRFLDVLVVATPSALLVATPLTFVAGMSRGNRHGIVFRSGSSLEQLTDIQTLAFDKTGTLTQGHASVDSVTAFGSYSDDDVIGLAASLVAGTTQPQARAITTAASLTQVKLVRPKHVRLVGIQGVQGSVKGHTVILGPQQILKSQDIIIPAKAAAGSATKVYVAVSNNLAGYITFQDDIRPEAHAVIGQLRKWKIVNMLMITSDSQRTAEALADELNISQVQTAFSPADKLRAIDAVTERPLAYLGNGVTEASILTAADIGIALGARGTVAASESADVTILPDNLGLVALAVAIAHRTMRIAKQCILVGLGLSLVLMLLFATGKLAPVWGVFALLILDVLVLVNALRAHTGKEQL